MANITNNQAAELDKAEEALTSLIEITGKTLLAASTADPEQVMTVSGLSNSYLEKVHSIHTILSQTIQKVAELNNVPILPSTESLPQATDTSSISTPVTSTTTTTNPDSTTVTSTTVSTMTDSNTLSSS